MADVLESLVVKLALDGSDYNDNIKKAQGSLDGFAGSAKSIGGNLTTGVTLPLLGVGAAAVKLSTDFNSGLANIASLGVAEDHVLDLKTGIQDLAIATGKSTDDIVSGAYDVISTWGDTADTLDLVEINARSAAAGLATTQDAIALTSAVTKGYGDTSKEATQHAADLAFQTVNLGQTTFPELASSIGKVVPIAAALGVSQEELFGQMATLTGVTGGAAEVTTQLRAVYQSILKPTTDMADAIQEVAVQLDDQGKLAGGPQVDAWHAAAAANDAAARKLFELDQQLQTVDKSTTEGAARARELESAYTGQKKALTDAHDAMILAAGGLGQTLVQSVGVTDAMNMLSATAEGNSNTMGKMFGSVEALTAQLALSGGQADSYKEKLAAMSDVSGAVDKAFTAQTEGLNKNGFTMAQAAVQAQVLMQKLGDGLAPALGELLDIATPWINKLIKMADWFAKTDAKTQTWIVSIVGIVAAIGPVLVIIGAMASGISALIGILGAASGAIGIVGAALTLLTGPIGLIVLAIAGLALAWTSDFGGIQEKTQAFWGWLTSSASSTWATVQSDWNTFSNFWQSDNATKLATVQSGWDAFTSHWSSQLQGAFSTVKGYWQSHSDDVIAIQQTQWDLIGGIWQTGTDGLNGILTAGAQIMSGDWQGGLQTLRDTANTVWTDLQGLFQTGLDQVKNLFTLAGFPDLGEDIAKGIADGVTAGLHWIEDAAKAAAQAALDAAKWILGISSPSTRAADEIGDPFTKGFGKGALDAMPAATSRIQNALNGLMSDLALPSVNVAGSGGAPINITVYASGGASYEQGRSLGEGIHDELRARGLA